MRYLLALLVLVTLNASAQQDLPPLPPEDGNAPSFALKQSANHGTVAVIVAAGAGVAAGLISLSDAEGAQQTAAELAVAGCVVSLGFVVSSQNRKREAARRFRRLGM